MDDESVATTTLADMPGGRAGVVVSIGAGKDLVSRLQALGIRPGRQLLKLNNMLMRGPVMLEVDRTQVAIGFGMAQKITIRLIRDDAHPSDRES